jgi:hypothetical protein
VTASTFPVRPTVEAVTAANTVFSCAFRGEPDLSLTHLARMDTVSFHALRLAVAMLKEQADQIQAKRDAPVAGPR